MPGVTFLRYSHYFWVLGFWEKPLRNQEPKMWRDRNESGTDSGSVKRRWAVPDKSRTIYIYIYLYILLHFLSFGELIRSPKFFRNVSYRRKKQMKSSQRAPVKSWQGAQRNAWNPGSLSALVFWVPISAHEALLPAMRSILPNFWQTFEKVSANSAGSLSALMRSAERRFFKNGLGSVETRHFKSHCWAKTCRNGTFSQFSALRPARPPKNKRTKAPKNVRKHDLVCRFWRWKSLGLQNGPARNFWTTFQTSENTYFCSIIAWAVGFGLLISSSRAPCRWPFWFWHYKNNYFWGFLQILVPTSVLGVSTFHRFFVHVILFRLACAPLICKLFWENKKKMFVLSTIK